MSFLELSGRESSLVQNFCESCEQLDIAQQLVEIIAVDKVRMQLQQDHRTQLCLLKQPYDWGISFSLEVQDTTTEHWVMDFSLLHRDWMPCAIVTLL